jgi:hypothetical protein
MEVSSTTSNSQSSGFFSLCLKLPFFESTSSSRWMVLASRPVVSAMRFAARPVGAQRSRFTRLATRIRRIAFTSVVLPTPGPPVITMTLDARAVRVAFFWLSAKARPVFPSTQGIALSAAISGHGGGPSIRTFKRETMDCSARYRLARNTQGRFPMESAMTPPASSSSFNASVIRDSGISKSLTARGISSSRGKPQCPSSSDSVRA